MNRKKIVTIIALCLILLAAEIAFVLLNPSPDSAPTEPVASTQGGVATTGDMDNLPTQPDTSESVTSASQTEAPEPTEDGTTGPTETTPPETGTAPTEMEPKPTETESVPTETEPGDDDYDNTGSNIGVSTEPVLTGDSEYERYMNMSAEEQEEYFNSFDSPEAFFDWYNAAKEEYENNRDVIEIGPDATVDLGNLGN